MGVHYDAMIQISKEANDINKAVALMSWDQETQMPTKGAPSRARQMATLSGLAHTTFTSGRMGQAILGAEGEGLIGPAAVNLREIRRIYQRLTKVPVRLVEEITETAAHGREHWRVARRENDFARFAPSLTRIIDLKRQYADAVGYVKEPYDALLEDYEPGMTSACLADLFRDLRVKLTPMMERVRSCKTPPRVDFLSRHYPKDKQVALSRRVLELMGFDFEAGRMEISTHPFTTSFAPTDVRLTTRYDEAFFPMAFFGTMHEGGHALYEQGLPLRHEGTPMGETVSLGIHESQSRLWENMVGRSRPFWRHFYPVVREAFPDALSDVSEEELYRGVNEVRPSHIRVEADEVSYNLHIILRFEIERDLLRGAHKPEDAPELWNRLMQEYVGILPPDDSVGVLQDIHWSMGLFGYFPTYTLGNLYAAQFMAKVSEDLSGFDERIASGHLQDLTRWLRERIHEQGMTWQAEDLVRQVTGGPLDAGHFVTYLERKFGEIYGL
jgi:carboxypeptidase Taq